MLNWQKQLNAGLQELKIFLSPVALEKLFAYVNLLLKWNKAYNLIGTNDMDILLTDHLLDSLSIVPYLKGQRIIDVGTGAGLPGIPLAIAFPEKEFFLLDSVGKKIHFLTQAVTELQLKNVQIVQERVERYRPEKCFDHIVLRAFGTISDIITKTQHLSCQQGSWLLMKGVYPAEELRDLQEKVTVITLNVPGLNKKRHLVYIEKTHE